MIVEKKQAADTLPDSELPPYQPRPSDPNEGVESIIPDGPPTSPNSPGTEFEFPDLNTAPVPGSCSSKCANDIAQHTTSMPINGTFILDPRLCTHIKGGTKRTKAYTRKVRIGDSSGAGGGVRYTTMDEGHPQPMATFSSQSGKIGVDLCIDAADEAVKLLAGSSRNLSGGKAKVEARSRSGNVVVNVRSIKPGFNVSLDVRTRSGDATLYIPSTFRGPIHLKSKKGTITILPALSRSIRVISTQGNDALVIMGDVASSQQTAWSPGDETRAIDWEGDYAQMFSKTGHIAIGIYGVDRKVAELSFWQKIPQLIMSAVRATGSSTASATPSPST